MVGIHLADSEEWQQINNNIVRNNDVSGITLSNVKNTSVSMNHIHDNNEMDIGSEAGLKLENGASFNNINGNFIHDNPQHGVHRLPQ